MKVVLYCRVASDDQLSLDMQEISLREYADYSGFEVVGCIKDNGVSGLQNDRSIQDIITLTERRSADAVLCRDVSRLSRDPIRFAEIYLEFKKRGKAVECLHSYGEIYLAIEEYLNIRSKKARA